MGEGPSSGGNVEYRGTQVVASSKGDGTSQSQGLEAEVTWKSISLQKFTLC